MRPSNTFSNASKKALLVAKAKHIVQTILSSLSLSNLDPPALQHLEGSASGALHLAGSSFGSKMKHPCLNGYNRLKTGQRPLLETAPKNQEDKIGWSEGVPEYLMGGLGMLVWQTWSKKPRHQCLAVLAPSNHQGHLCLQQDNVDTSAKT
jgi:hypothetical protein